MISALLLWRWEIKLEFIAAVVFVFVRWLISIHYSMFLSVTHIETLYSKRQST